MPTYEYACDNEDCACVTEKTCHFAERYDSPACEKCGGTTHQIISGSTFVLKGNGWARDGYGSKKATDTKK